MASTYRAIRMTRFAPAFREACEIAEVPIEEPPPGMIRVRNRFAGVNGIFDTQMARNAVGYIEVALPTLTGVEAVGVVEAVGDGVTSLAPGDAVASLRFRSGYREVNLGAAEDFVRVPEASRETLALVSTGVAALVALERAAEVKQGETVAISAAAGGLGQFYVQLAKLKGARVIALCGGEEKSALVRALGADHVIDYRNKDVAEALRRDFADALDVAIDTVGRAVFDAFLDNLAPHGRLIVSGFARDMDGELEAVTAPRIAHKLYYKGASVRAFQNGLMTRHWPEARERLFALHAAGKLKILFDDHPFAGIEGVFDAVERLVSGQSTGKVALPL